MTKLINILQNFDSIAKPRAILLDWDNTLADSWKIIHRCLNDTFTHFGMENWPIEDVITGKGNIHHSLRESFPVLFGDKWEAAKDKYYEAFIACHLDEIAILPGGLETIKALAESNVFLGIVSNKTGKYLREELKHLNIDQYFDIIIGATDALKDKPHREPLIMALEKSGIAESEFATKVWMVGDSVTDIESAFNTGVMPVLYGNVDVAKYLEQGSVYCIADHDEFYNIARKLK